MTILSEASIGEKLRKLLNCVSSTKPLNDEERDEYVEAAITRAIIASPAICLNFVFNLFEFNLFKFKKVYARK
jgi:hypothetical protein